MRNITNITGESSSGSPVNPIFYIAVGCMVLHVGCMFLHRCFELYPIIENERQEIRQRIRQRRGIEITAEGSQIIENINKIKSELNEARELNKKLTSDEIKDLANSFRIEYNQLSFLGPDLNALYRIIEDMEQSSRTVTGATIHAAVSRQIDYIKSLPENSNEYQFFLEAMKNIFGEKEVSTQMEELFLTPSQVVASASSSSTTLHCRTSASSSGQQP